MLGSVKAGEKKDKKSLSALVGVLLAIPVLCAVVPLLVKSDAAFEGLVSGVVLKFAWDPMLSKTDVPCPVFTIKYKLCIDW